MSVFERLEKLSDDDLRGELIEKGYYPPPIQDEITRNILRKKLARLIDPSIVLEEPNDSFSDANEECGSAGDTKVRSRNRVRFSDVTVTHPAAEPIPRGNSANSIYFVLVLCFSLMCYGLYYLMKQ